MKKWYLQNANWLASRRYFWRYVCYQHTLTGLFIIWNSSNCSHRINSIVMMRGMPHRGSSMRVSNTPLLLKHHGYYDNCITSRWTFLFCSSSIVHGLLDSVIEKCIWVVMIDRRPVTQFVVTFSQKSNIYPTHFAQHYKKICWHGGVKHLYKYTWHVCVWTSIYDYVTLKLEENK